jgi:hypothetical protein
MFQNEPILQIAYAIEFLYALSRDGHAATTELREHRHSRPESRAHGGIG